jgi:GntR family transcriptional regulator
VQQTDRLRSPLDAIESSKTHRFYLLIKERIASGVLPAGGRLPSEPDLAAQHGLSRVTVRRALDGLARDGLITRQPGAGTFVSGRTSPPPLVADLSDMMTHLAAMGRDTQVRLLSFGYGQPPAAVAEALGLATGAITQAAVRVRSIDGSPFSHLTTHVPEAIGRSYSAEELGNTPLLSLLERCGVAAAHAEQTISATVAGPEVAQALGVEIGSALLSLIRVVRDARGRGVEHLAALYRPDIHAFRMELTRAGSDGDRHWKPLPRHAISTPSNGRRGASTSRRRT